MSILADLFKFSNAFESGNYEKAGEEIGNILKLATTQPNALQVYKPKKEVNDFAEIVQGFYAGSGYKASFLDVLICIYQADQAALELYADVQLWEEAFRDKSWFEGLFAVIFLFAFGQAVRGQVLPACVPLAQGEWGAFKGLDMLMQDPVNNLDVVGREIRIGGHSITDKVQDAAKKCMAGNFHDCGFGLGQAFLAPETENPLFLY